MTTLVSVVFSNDSGLANFTQTGTAPSIGPKGEPFSPTGQLVGENFSQTASTHVLVASFGTDDYGNTPQTATALAPGNVDLPGRIDQVCDIDFFRVSAVTSGTLAVRVSNFALGIQPRIAVYKSDGMTSMGQYDFYRHHQPNYDYVACYVFMASVGATPGYAHRRA